MVEKHLQTGAFTTLDRTWQNGDTVTLVLPLHTRLEQRARGAVSVLRGPLVYGLRIGERFEQIRGEPRIAITPCITRPPGTMVSPSTRNLREAVSRCANCRSVRFRSRPKTRLLSSPRRPAAFPNGTWSRIRQVPCPNRPFMPTRPLKPSIHPLRQHQPPHRRISGCGIFIIWLMIEHKLFGVEQRPENIFCRPLTGGGWRGGKNLCRLAALVGCGEAGQGA